MREDLGRINLFTSFISDRRTMPGCEIARTGAGKEDESDFIIDVIGKWRRWCGRAKRILHSGNVYVTFSQMRNKLTFYGGVEERGFKMSLLKDDVMLMEFTFGLRSARKTFFFANWANKNRQEYITSKAGKISLTKLNSIKSKRDKFDFALSLHNTRRDVVGSLDISLCNRTQD